MAKWLLAPGSIPELAMRRCVLGKDTLPIVMAQTDKKTLQTEFKQGCSAFVWLELDRRSASFVRINE